MAHIFGEISYMYTPNIIGREHEATGYKEDLFEEDGPIPSEE